MSVHIHLGAHKTATTHLQRSLVAIEGDLLAQGIAFLGPTLLRTPPLDLRALLNDPDRMARDRDAVVPLLRGLIRDHSRVVISEELILGGLDHGNVLGRGGRLYLLAENRVSNLLRLLGHADITLYLALRSPADFATSLYGEQVLRGAPPRIEEFLGDYDLTAMRWSDLVTRILNATGAPRLVCWRYEDLDRIRPAMLADLIGPSLAGIVPDLPPARVGLSTDAHHMIRNGVAAGGDLRRLVSAARAAHPRRLRGGGRVRLLPDALHDACDAAYAEDCARIADLPRVRFLRPGPCDIADDAQG